MSKGAVLSLLSAFFYASYLVLVKYKSDTEEKINIPLFFGNKKCLFFSLDRFPFLKLFLFPTHRFCWTMELIIIVASIFYTKLYTNRDL